MKMEWDKLLSVKRLGKVDVQKGKGHEPRTEFTRDYDRIVFSSAFRRLQDKAQVFPLAKSDYVRTRLTHSMEVASVGRSLGMLAADTIIKKAGPLPGSLAPQDVGTIVATACLAHDIGNPPFGHAGESAIQEWFDENAKQYLGGMPDAEKQDLLKFEGNAHGFRTLCKLQNTDQPGGLQLTAAVLGTFTKYPRASSVEESQTKGISGKKFGFMQSESEHFTELAEELGLIPKAGKNQAWYRHPLSFLVEAADDICYHVIDVEDGFKSGVITYDELLSLHKPWLDKGQINKLESISIPQRKAEYLRATTIHKMILEAHAVFAKNYTSLMNGTFDDELVTNIAHASEFKEFMKVAVNKVYTAKPVLEIEACGFEVIGGLLKAFVAAIEDKAKNGKKAKIRSRTLMGLLPEGLAFLVDKTPYERALVATDFIAGMTDSYALELYQRIHGISLA